MPPKAQKLSDKSIHVNSIHGTPLTAPHHGWLTSPARSQASSRQDQAKELPLHLIVLILSHLDNVADLARLTRTSRLLYYMTLPRLYEHVTLHSYADIRYVDGRPEGYGSGSPFSMGLNTLVSRNYTDYIKTFRVVGDWREHDVEDYSKGRVPDNSMMLQVAVRAALDKMKNLNSFAWELNTKPLQTIWQGIINKPSITCLTLRFQTKRIPRPTTLVPPLPNLKTLVLYDIDPLCYPDDVSLLLLHATKLENMKMHFNPRMRESGEESVNLVNFFGRCIAAKVQIPLKRIAMYNLYARNSGDGFEQFTDAKAAEEMTIINCMGSSQDPTTVFLDDTWRLSSSHEVPPNLKMMRCDFADSHHVAMLSKIRGLERLYLINNRRKAKSRASTGSASTGATPGTPSLTATPSANGTGSAGGTPATEQQCKTLAGDYLAVVQSNHGTMRHLLLLDGWQLSEEAASKLFQSCPNLEQVGMALCGDALPMLRRLVALAPRLWALRILIRPGSELADRMEAADADMHQFALATELWQAEFRNLRYLGLGDKHVYRLGKVAYPARGAKGTVPPGQERSMNARRAGPVRMMKRIDASEVQDIEIWRMDSSDFDSRFP